MWVGAGMAGESGGWGVETSGGWGVKMSGGWNVGTSEPFWDNSTRYSRSPSGRGGAGRSIGAITEAGNLDSEQKNDRIIYNR